MRLPGGVHLWRCPKVDCTEVNAAERATTTAGLRIDALMPNLLAHRDRNHFAERVEAALREEHRT